MEEVISVSFCSSEKMLIAGKETNAPFLKYQKERPSHNKEN